MEERGTTSRFSRSKVPLFPGPFSSSFFSQFLFHAPPFPPRLVVLVSLLLRRFFFLLLLVVLLSSFLSALPPSFSSVYFEKRPLNASPNPVLVLRLSREVRRPPPPLHIFAAAAAA
jgi:hypothetical protein